MATDITHVASWRDEPFPCLDIDVLETNALVKTTYPHREGQHVVNLGRLGVRWQVNAIFSPGFNGRGPYAKDLYPYGYLRFLEACRDKERGYFDDPGHGLAWAQCESVSSRRGPADAFYVSATFVESNLDEPTYTTRLTVGDGGSSLDSAATRAGDLDAMMASRFPDMPTADLTLFADAWSTFAGALYAVDQVINILDLAVCVNIFQQSLTSIQTSYPTILSDAINWNMQYEISKLRLDAVSLAQRTASAQDKRIIDYELMAQISSLELAVMLYGDPFRSSEIERLNNITDPMFLRPGIYKVMSA